jgi:hypothetical protein
MSGPLLAVTGSGVLGGMVPSGSSRVESVSRHRVLRRTMGHAASM